MAKKNLVVTLARDQALALESVLGDLHQIRRALKSIVVVKGSQRDEALEACRHLELVLDPLAKLIQAELDQRDPDRKMLGATFRIVGQKLPTVAAISLALTSGAGLYQADKALELSERMLQFQQETTERCDTVAVIPGVGWSGSDEDEEPTHVITGKAAVAQSSASDATLIIGGPETTDADSVTLSITADDEPDTYAE